MQTLMKPRRKSSLDRTAGVRKVTCAKSLNAVFIGGILAIVSMITVSGIGDMVEHKDVVKSSYT